MISQTTSTIRRPSFRIWPNHNQTLIRPALVLALTLLGGAAAWAEPQCQPLHGVVRVTEVFDNCASPIGLCLAGEFRGVLNGSSDIVATTAAPTVDTAATGVLSVTGDNTIHLEDGDLSTKDTVIFAPNGRGEFAEVDVIVGGTGAYAGASGRYVISGLFTNGEGEASYEGEICRP
jgi:hypothetical protein